jgi:hypothetical protein
MSSQTKHGHRARQNCGFPKEEVAGIHGTFGLYVVRALPRTPHGKLDRKRCRHRSEPTRVEERFVAPRTRVEEVLADIWAAVLKLDKVDATTASS